MAHRTRFAGLAAPDPGEGEMVLNGDLIYANPDLIDQFLRIGAISHRHDNHLRLQDPQAAVTLAAGSGGSLQGNSTYYVAYTVNDQYGGETRGAPDNSIFVFGQVAPPSNPPSGGVDHTGGIMPAGSYAYAETYTDGQGGETPLGPVTWITVPPGFASSQVNFVGLASQLAPSGNAVAGRLWRSYEGNDWHLVRQSTTDTFTDTGFDPPDNPARPPINNTTFGTGSITVTLPTALAEPALSSGSLINVFMSTDPGMQSPAFLMSLPIACAGASFTVTSDAVSYGAPPPVSHSIPGAALINPDTDILDWHWKRPVATSTALPSGAQGDVRMTLNTGHLWGVLSPSGAATYTGWTDLLALASGAEIDLPAGVGASAGSASGWVTDIQFAGSGGTNVQFQSLGGGSGVVIISAQPTATFVASAGSASATIGPFLGFAGSGGTGVELVQSGGSSVVLISVSPGATGPPGPQGGSAGVTVAGSAGLGAITPTLYAEFAGSGSIDVVVQNLGGNSARVLIGSPGGIPKATQASGYAFGVNDPGTVVESASAGNGSSMTAFYVNPHSQTPIPVDSVIEFFQYGTGQVMIVPSGGVVLRSDGGKNKTAGQFATGGLRQRAFDEWVLSGDLST